MNGICLNSVVERTFKNEPENASYVCIELVQMFVRIGYQKAGKKIQIHILQDLYREAENAGQLCNEMVSNYSSKEL